MWVFLYVMLHGHPMPPCPGEFERILLERYEVGENDCSNKAGQYARACNAAGHHATVIIVRPPGEHQDLHAIVEVDGLYCDPTTGRVTHALADHGERVTDVSAYHLNNDEEFA